MSEPITVSSKKLLASTGVALAAAGVLLVTAVLPAEYGIDPIGVGAALGIKGMSAEADEEPVDASIASEPAAEQTEEMGESSAVWKSAAAYRSDELSLTLAPNEGAEIKALMKTGERFVFSWEATGLVNFDMHGEVAGAKSNEFTSHWKGRQEQSGHGAFVAPFDGTHGWYWRNRGVKPVTVVVKTSGFYEKLYRP
jgi:hypothetical protein